MKRIILSIVPLFIALLPVGLHAQDRRLTVVATTTLIADVARNIGGDLADVTALIPPDSDVHAFQPAPQDAALIAGADVVLVNGANLEEGLLALVEGSARVPLTVVSNGALMLAFGGHDHHDDDDHEHDDHSAVEYIGVLGLDAVCGEEAHHDEGEHNAEDEAEVVHDHEHGACDPHVWSSPQNVEIWTDNIAAAFAAADPDNAAVYRDRAAAYKDQLALLDAELEALFASIPEAGRVIVTNHEFLGYLAARYDFDIVGTVIPSASTLAEPSPQDIAALIGTIRETGVKAIFAEASDAGALARVIGQEAGDIAVVTLYSDSLSAPDGPAPTYIDFMRFNAQAIAGALMPS
jgi:zinc/manganese transport system substrate-binding protein